MNKFELLTTLPVANELGEGAVWNAEQQAFWWTDIYGKRLFRYHLSSATIDSWPMPEPVGCFGFMPNSDKLMVASLSGIGFWTVGAKEIEFFAKPEQDRVENRFNDGKTDPAGRFWAGAMVEDFITSDDKAGLYKVEPDLTVAKMMDGFRITNSLCWNRAGDKMYHADSPSDKIYSYDYEITTGTPSNKQLLMQTDGSCVPDGASTDVDGGIWVAHWQRSKAVNRSKVVRFNPDGSESLLLEVPVSQCTCVAFGGPKMDLLLVTSAKRWLDQSQLAAQPQAGNVLIYQTDYRGVQIPAIQSNQS